LAENSCTLSETKSRDSVGMAPDGAAWWRHSLWENLRYKLKMQRHQLDADFMGSFALCYEDASICIRGQSSLLVMKIGLW